VPVNAVDRPDISTFITPAIVDRDPVVIGISSGGAAPVLARRIRERLEALLPANLGRLASFAENFRQAVAARLTSESMASRARA
jgi:uroporphyrin-III C-methyltransferase/precorrin-2 dehydrogenase/sirohydrochlorin ferrochelatase